MFLKLLKIKDIETQTNFYAFDGLNRSITLSYVKNIEFEPF